MLILMEYKNDKENFGKKIYYPKQRKLNALEHAIVTTDTDKGKCVTFQGAMKLTLIIGQAFGLNPVQGIMETDSSKLRFKFLSMRCMYTLLSIVGQSIMVGFCINRAFIQSPVNLGSGTSVLFYGVNCITTMLFLRIATQWPALCKHISRTETVDPNSDVSLVKKCNITCVLILTLALFEHILSAIAGFAVAIDCYENVNMYEGYILDSFPWIFKILPYNHFLGFLTQALNFQSTFNWNFADVFVTCISFYLISRLEQINNRILAVRGKETTVTFWRIIREDYNRVTQLVRRIDDVISSIVFVSFANNLLFICVQLLHTLEDGLKGAQVCNQRLRGFRPLKGYEHPIYFVYSFVFLMGRSLAVSLIAARVHSATLDAAPSLYDVPSTVYCIEVQRLLEQMHGATVALSGLKFFNVKRGLVLTIAGTIVTYELVLMQFTGVTPTPSPPSTSTSIINVTFYD